MPRNGRAAIGLFRYSISYLTLLFAAVAARRPRLRCRSSRAGRSASTAPRRARARSAARRSSSRAGAPILVAHPGHDDDRHPDEEGEVADDPHDDPAELLVLERARAPRAQVRDVVRVEDRAGAQQRDAEERVLRQRQEEVEEAHRVRHPPRRRVDADDRPPEEQRRGEEASRAGSSGAAGSRAPRRRAC